MIKPLKRYENKYTIDEDGNVYSLESNSFLKRRKGKGNRKDFYTLKNNNGKETNCSARRLLIENLGFTKEGFKDIPGFENENGIVWSKYNNKQIAQERTPTSRYMYVKLNKNNKTKHMSVHRVVALTYIPNPDNLPVVDHIDRNIYNNNVKNLRWVTYRDNLLNSEEGFVRNFTECELYYKGEKISNFKSISEASRYASKIYGVSRTMMSKHKKNGDCEIKVQRLSPQGE